jgi:hypothetical protein
MRATKHSNLHNSTKRRFAFTWLFLQDTSLCFSYSRRLRSRTNLCTATKRISLDSRSHRLQQTVGAALAANKDNLLDRASCPLLILAAPIPNAIHWFYVQELTGGPGICSVSHHKADPDR